MVETVSAQPLPTGTHSGSTPPVLEPGTELRAKVDANLPGGVVRLVTDNRSIELRVATPLPVGGEVTVSVSGSRQQPAIVLTPVTSAAPPPSAGGPAQGVPSQVAPSTPPQGTPPPQGSAPATGQAPGTPAVPTAPQGSPPAGSAPVTAAPRPAPVLAQYLQATGVLPPSTPSGPPVSVPGQIAQQLPSSPTQPSIAAPSAPPVAGGSVPVASPPAASLPVSPGPGARAPVSVFPGIAPPVAAAPQAGQLLATTPVGSMQSPQPPQSASGPGPAAPTPGGAAQGTPVSSPLSAVPAAGTPGVLPVPAGGGQVMTSPLSGAASGTVSAQGTPVAATGGGPVPLPATPVTPVQLPAPPGTVPASPAAGSLPLSASGQPLPATSAAPVNGTAGPVSGTPTASGGDRGLVISASGIPASGVPAGARPAVSGQPGTGFGQAPAVGSLGTGATATPAPGPTVGSPAGNPGATAANSAPGGPANAVASAQAGIINPAGTPQPQASQGGGTVLSGPAAGSPAGPAPAVPGGGASAVPSQAQAYLATRPGGVSTAAAGGAAATSGQAASGPATPLQQAAAFLRQPLAEQQAGLGSLFAQISSLMSAQSAGKASVPDAVQKAMQQILGLRLNSSQPVTAQALQQAVRQSGQGGEARLPLPSGAQQTAGIDLKSALLSFKALLQGLGAEPAVRFPARQPAPASRSGAPQGQAPQTSSGYWAGSAPQNLQSLLQETDAALARLRLTQLTNAGLSGDDGVKAASGKPMDAVVELPLAFGQETGVLQMQVGRDGGGKAAENGEDPAWRLRFALDLTATGPLEAAVSLRGGGTYISLWVDRKETLDLLTGLKPTMEASFADAGLDLQELRFIRGLPPKTAAKYGALINRQS